MTTTKSTRSKNSPEIRALSIAGPFARLIAEGSKEIELRSWRTSYRGLVLLHSSSSRDYDYFFSSLEMNQGECPKAAIIGVATLTDCITYSTEDLWNSDLDRHWWMGNEPYATIRQQYYGSKPPIGHVFANPAVFVPPIPDVPGARQYWLPKNKRQYQAFEEAIALCEQLFP